MESEELKLSFFAESVDAVAEAVVVDGNLAGDKWVGGTPVAYDKVLRMNGAAAGEGL